jgi:hypothetical protein
VGWNIPHGGVCKYTSRFESLAELLGQSHNAVMRALALLLVAAAVSVGAYVFFLRKMPVSDPGTASTQAISLTGVRGDLLQIGQAERGSIALNGKCTSLDELISSGTLTMARPEREGYVYALECSGNDFGAVARHAPAPAGSPIRYPVLRIDSTMEVHEISAN